MLAGAGGAVVVEGPCEPTEDYIIHVWLFLATYTVVLLTVLVCLSPCVASHPIEITGVIFVPCIKYLCKDLTNFAGSTSFI